MTRPKPRETKSKSRGGSVPPAGGAPAGAQQLAAQQQQHQHQQAGQQQQQQQQAVQEHQQAAAKKRPAEAGAAAAAAAGLGEQPEVDQLERKRMQVAEELRQVEKQIFDLETNYFQISSAMGNAIRGYEGFLGGSKKAAAPVQPEERLFSWSSVTGQLGTAGAPDV